MCFLRINAENSSKGTSLRCLSRSGSKDLGSTCSAKQFLRNFSLILVECALKSELSKFVGTWDNEGKSWEKKRVVDIMVEYSTKSSARKSIVQNITTKEKWKRVIASTFNLYLVIFKQILRNLKIFHKYIAFAYKEIQQKLKLYQ